MARLLVHVEGQTEETFVDEVLAPHLYRHGYVSVGSRLIGNSPKRERRGGITGWSAVRRDIINHLRGDLECFSTIMVDYYALPQTDPKAWPGRHEANSVLFPQNAATVKNALLADICSEMGTGFNPKRFLPYVVMHELEGLLFSDCERFAQGIGRVDLASSFLIIRNSFGTPEEINDSALTAPSKRIKSLMPDYDKPLFGALAVRQIGLEAIRKECPLFREWLEHLEALTAKPIQ